MSSRRIWSPREDEVFKKIVENLDTKNWAVIAKKMASQGFKRRTGKQCRQRWFNHLDPDVTKKAWSKAEEQKMLNLHKTHGNKWTIIAEQMPGRSDNSIKNYFYSTIRRNLRRMGKYLGSKNSTGLMRQIKPSTMTKIFGSINEEQHESIYKYLEQEGLTRSFLAESCQNIRNEIIQFSYFKPKKNDLISEQNKTKYEQVFWLIQKVNQIYQKVKKQERSLRTDKQIFRLYYQQMQKDSEDEKMESQSEDLQFAESVQQQQPEYQSTLLFIKPNSQLRTSKQIQIISLSKPNLPAPIIVRIGQNQLKDISSEIIYQNLQKQIDANPDQTNFIKKCESALQNIVQFAQEIEFEDPQFNIEIPDNRQKGEGNNIQMQMSNMSFRSHECSFGTPVSQVNFFNSPRTAKITCLSDLLMKMSGSNNRDEFGLDLSGSAKQMEKEGTYKKYS